MQKTDKTKTVAELGAESFASTVARPEGTWVREDQDLFRLYEPSQTREQMDPTSVSQEETEGGENTSDNQAKAPPRVIFDPAAWLEEPVTLTKDDGSTFEVRRGDRIAFLYFLNGETLTVTPASMGVKAPWLGGHQRGLRNALEAAEVAGYDGFIGGMATAGIPLAPFIGNYLRPYYNHYAAEQARMDALAATPSAGQA